MHLSPAADLVRPLPVVLRVDDQSGELGIGVLALLGLATVSANQLILEEDNIYNDDELTELLKITITGKNIQNVDNAHRQLGQALQRTVPHQDVLKQAGKDMQAILKTKEFHDLVKYAQTLDPHTNVAVRKDLMAVHEQVLKLEAAGIKVLRRGKESHLNPHHMEAALRKGEAVWIHEQNEDVAAFDKEFGDEMKVEMGIMKHPWAKTFVAKINALRNTAQFKAFDKHQTTYGGSAKAKQMRAEIRKFMTTVGQNIKVEDIPKDIRNYNLVHAFQRMMHIMESFAHGKIDHGLGESLKDMKVYTKHVDDDDSDSSDDEE